MSKVFSLLVLTSATALSACGPSAQHCAVLIDDTNKLTAEIQQADFFGKFSCTSQLSGSGVSFGDTPPPAPTQQQKDQDAAQVAACEATNKARADEQAKRKVRLAQLNQEKAKC